MRRCTKIDKYEVWHWLLTIALHLTYISWSWETWLLTIIPGNKINGNTSANPSILTSKFGAGYSKYCVFIFCVEFDWHSLFWCTLRLWDDVFLLGGDQISEVNFYRARWVYPPLSPWPSPSSSSSHPRYHSLIILNINDRITMTEVECFDPLTNEWTLSKALPESRFYHKIDLDCMRWETMILIIKFYQITLNHIEIAFNTFFRSESGAVVIWKNAKSCQVINM